LQQNCAINVRLSDLFVEGRYFKLQDEIQFSSNTVMTAMEQLWKHRDSHSFCGCNM